MDFHADQAVAEMSKRNSVPTSRNSTLEVDAVSVTVVLIPQFLADVDVGALVEHGDARSGDHVRVADRLQGIDVQAHVGFR